MAKVYRYEIKAKTGTNHGPYNSSDALQSDGLQRNQEYETLRRAMNDKHTNETHPSIARDISDFTMDYYCACLTIKELKAWFKGFNIKLKRLGFNIVEYDVQSFEVGDSRKQCCFKQNWVNSKKVVN